MARLHNAGKVELAAKVSGTVKDVPDRWLGESDPWSVYFDEAGPTPINTPIRVQWSDFDADDAPAHLREFAAEHFFCELNDSKPILWLNKSEERFGGLPALLDDRKGRGKTETALHNAERVSICRTMWMAMLGVSIAAVEPPDDEREDPAWPDEPWKKQVLESVLPTVYRDHGTTEALRLVTQEWREPGAAAKFESRATMAVNRLVKSERLLNRTLRVINRSLADDPEED